MSNPIQSAGPAPARITSKQRLDALLDQDDARAAIRARPAEELYFAIADVGLADCTEIIQLASPQQFRTFVDLGGWERDRIEPHQVLTWLRAARGDESEDHREKVKALDVELLESVLRTFTTVHSLEEDPGVNPEGTVIETPEGKYLIELTVEGVDQYVVRMVINDLIAENPFESVRLLEALRWELPSELEETAYRFRSARLADLGFPTFEEALSLYGYLAPETYPPRTASTVALAAGSARPDWIAAALAGLDARERENLESELRLLINAALVADAADPGDLDALRRLGEQTRDYLALGLEQLCGGDPAHASEVVREHPLKRVFQIGFSLTLKLRFRATRLGKEPLSRLDGVDLLLPDERAAVAALRRKRPLRALKVEGAEPVGFRSRRELAEADALLDRAQLQATVFRGLLGGNEEVARAAVASFGAPMERLGAERLWAAILARAVLDGPGTGAAPAIGPVPALRLAELGQRLFEDAPPPRLRASAAERAFAALSPHVEEGARDELRRMVDRGLAKLLAELGPPFLREGTLDPLVVVILPIEGHAVL